MGVETADSVMIMLQSWNHQVHLWLKFYIMARLTPVGKRPSGFANMATFMVSAFWHGFYPTYYFLFFTAGLLSEATKDIYKSRSLFSFIPAILRPFFGNFFSMLCLNYCGILQTALTWEKGFHFFCATWGLVPIFLMVFLFFSRTFGLVKMVQKMDAKQETLKTNQTAPTPTKEATVEDLKKID